MSMRPGWIFRFGEFELDVRARSLRREKTAVFLNSRAFDVLSYFVQNPGKVLSRDELLKNVWAGSFVDENSVAQSISALRRALDEKPGDNSFIVTLPGRGYQFVSVVQVVASEDGNAPSEMTTAEGICSSGLVFHKDTIQTRVITTQEEKEQLSSPVSRSRVANIIAASAIAATLVTSLVLGGVWYRRSYRPSKLTEKDTIVVADFENRTDDPVFDDTLKQALTVNLEQSPYLNVVSDQKIGEALKLMGRDTAQRITGEVSRDLCQRVRGNALLQGSIASFGSQYVVAFTVTNCATGDLLAAEQVRAERKEKILPAVDRAASSLREKLGESLDSIEKYDTPVEQASTPSLAALQAYSAGVNAWKRDGNEAAISFYKRAIELDPNFVIAYAHLGNSYNNLAEKEPAIENTNKAFGLRDRVSEREKLYIDSRYHMIVTGDIEKAILVLEQWRRVYPREWIPAFTLAVEYRKLGRYEESLREARASLLLEPSVQDNYYYLVFAALNLNRLDEAQAVLKEWQARNSVSIGQVLNDYWLAFLRADPAGMQKESARGMGLDGGEAFLFEQAGTEAYHGRFRRARELTRRGMALENGFKESPSLWAAARQIDAALWEAVAGYSEQARRDVSTAVKLSRSDETQTSSALALALAGDTRRADAITAELAERKPLGTLLNVYWLPSARASIQLGHNNPAKAVQELEVTSRFELGDVMGGDGVPLLPVYVRGQAFLALRQGREAAAEFQKYIDHPGVVMNNPIGAVARVELARAYAMQGDTVKARTAYEDFFNLWKDADPDIPIMKEAKAEYAKLQ